MPSNINKRKRESTSSNNNNILVVKNITQILNISVEQAELLLVANDYNEDLAIENYYLEVENSQQQQQDDYNLIGTKKSSST